MQGSSEVVDVPVVRAAQYVRMSTEHQQYSIDNQANTILRYAETHNMRVVRTYVDAGKSGLTIDNRAGLQNLLQDVENGQADYSIILVYDVSRWGRFQDTDESAYYEYRCKRAKIAVHYCAEVFANDGSITSALLKALKRTMAAEYSRELSRKVFAGKCRLIELGFRQGGHAGYGLRRLLVDHNRNPKILLKPGERKSILTDRIILVPGPEQEIEVVREIYDRFIDQKNSPAAIARDLNRRAILTEHGRPWTRAIIRDVLTNPKYVGVNVFNRRSYKLKSYTRNPPAMWISVKDAFTPIVSAERFQLAEETLEARWHRYTDDELLALLRALLQKRGRLCAPIINAEPRMPGVALIGKRFGGLIGAYRRIGYRPDDNFEWLDTKRTLVGQHERALSTLLQDLRAIGVSVDHDTVSGLSTINQQLTVKFVLARCRHTKYRGTRWFLRTTHVWEPDVTIVARMAPSNEAVQDYFILPRGHGLPACLDIAEENGITVDVYRFRTLDVLKELLQPKHL
jgi:DNA invertase Pin-like site-specific DNA recombinase